MVIRSPPTSRAIDARSSVVAMTFNLPCAERRRAQQRNHRATSSLVCHSASIRLLITKSRRSRRSSVVIVSLRVLRGFVIHRRLIDLERMRAVRADRELELEQELVRRRADRVVGAPVLPAHLAELARPVRQDRRPARCRAASRRRRDPSRRSERRRTSAARTDSRPRRSSPCRSAVRSAVRGGSRSLRSGRRTSDRSSAAAASTAASRRRRRAAS